MVVAILAFVVGVIGIGNPSLWFDESATLSAASRPLDELVELAGAHDSAHTFYYLLMHGWFTVFPETEAWARVPSCFAIAAAAAGVVVLGRLLSTPAVGLTAGIVFAILPRVTWAAIEARPYALAAAVSVWLTICLLLAIRGSRGLRWVIYAGMLTVAVLVNIHILLLVPVHLCILRILRVGRPLYVRWTMTTAATIVVLLPYLLFMKSKSGQINWIDPVDSDVVRNLVETQYFVFAHVFAGLAYLVIGLAVVQLVRGRRTSDHTTTSVAAICVAWIVLPTAGILLYSLLVQTIYVDRYLTFTSPAMGLLLGAAIVSVARNAVRIGLVIAVFAVAATPNYLHERADYAKFGMDYSRVADFVALHTSPGDCLVLDDTQTTGPVRALIAARPSAYDELVDVSLGERATVDDVLWDRNVPLRFRQDLISTCTVIWAIGEFDPALSAHESGNALPPGPDFGATTAFGIPAQLGFRIVERWQFSTSQVTRSVR